MIPRYQRVLFWILVASILLSSLFLLRGCQQAHKRLTAATETAPIAPPTASTTENLNLYLASDDTGVIAIVQRPMALPVEPTTRARVLLNNLLVEYALPGSAHPLQPGPAVDDVFLVQLPLGDADSDIRATGQLAVINLHDTFVANHPSGILVENLTVQSIIGTLHAALPDVTEIRFLVNGQPHDTLAGHADLLRTYPATDTSYTPAPPVADLQATP